MEDSTKQTEIRLEEVTAAEEKTGCSVSDAAETNSSDESKAEGRFYRSFKTKDDFIRAYTSLEKEFTRKSQELSELKKGKSFDADAEAERFLGAFPEAGRYAEEIAAALEDAGDLTVGAMERAYLKVLQGKKEDRETFVTRAFSDQEIREKVVLDYLNNLPSELPRLTTGGRAPAVEPKRAKNLSEAGKEALQILKR